MAKRKRGLPSWDHIDPRNGKLVCGLDVQSNLFGLSFEENVSKQNLFVPYRARERDAPRKFGDTCEFLIEGEWMVCEFGGEEWKREADRIGCGRTDGGRTAFDGEEAHLERSFRGGKTQGRRNKDSGHWDRMQGMGVEARRMPVVLIRVSDGQRLAFPSRWAASQELGLHQTLLRHLLRGERETYNGYAAAPE